MEQEAKNLINKVQVLLEITQYLGAFVKAGDHSHPYFKGDQNNELELRAYIDQHIGAMGDEMRVRWQRHKDDVVCKDSSWLGGLCDLRDDVRKESNNHAQER